MYIQQLIRKDHRDLQKILLNDLDIEDSEWLYEHFRQICIEANRLIGKMMFACDCETCPKMVVQFDNIDLEFMCAGHAEPRACSALQYCIHTMNKINYDLNESPQFKSRLSLEMDVIFPLEDNKESFLKHFDDF